jgi:hypothetical protein
VSRDQLTTVLAIVVATVWAVAALTATLTGETPVLAAITPVMLVVAGFLFGYRSSTKEPKDPKE